MRSATNDRDTRQAAGGSRLIDRFCIGGGTPHVCHPTPTHQFRVRQQAQTRKLPV
jgi:hypothetical protein